MELPKIASQTEGCKNIRQNRRRKGCSETLGHHPHPRPSWGSPALTGTPETAFALSLILHTPSSSQPSQSTS